MKKHERDKDPDQVRLQLQKIVESAQFQGSKRHRKFLAYVINETLAGRADRIKAYAIATEVFGRGDDFDPQIDPIVRIEAHRLRRALDHYYLTAGKNDPIRITIPKGGYGAVFERVGPSVEEVVSHAEDSVSPTSSLKIEARMERRLTTILAADLVGYSRMMAADEEGVISRLQATRDHLIDPTITDAGGRIVKTMGDGLLVEFPSSVMATRAAIDFQNAMTEREAKESEKNRLRFRVGINLGDIVIDQEDILGDGVNVAARLESLAPAGGICISRSVHDQVKGKVDAALISLGPQSVKNIPEPIEMWVVAIEGADALPPRQRAKAERPSIAVLPFDNMSSDPDQDFLVDGLVDDLITELSRFRSLFVIARNSSFSYKGSSTDVRTIAKELGVRYIVEGSVRRAGNRIRVTAQLIDAGTGAHVWADRWDHVMDDLFELQDELTTAIVTNVEPELGAHERQLIRAKPTKSLTAWELSQKGYGEFLSYTPEEHEAAIGHLREAISLDPQFSLPYAHLSRVYWYRITSGRTVDKAADSAEGLKLARKAVELDDRNEAGYLALGVHLSIAGQEDDAHEALARGIALNPNNAQLQFGLGIVHFFAVDPVPDELEKAALETLRLSPRDLVAPACYTMVGFAQMFRDLENTAAILGALESACRYTNADYFSYALAAVFKMRMGDEAAARRYLESALERRSELTLSGFRTMFKFPYWPKIVAKIEPDINALTSIGLRTD